MRDEPSGRVRRLSSTRRQAVDRQPLRAEYSDDRQTDSATNVLKTHGRTTQLTFSQHSVDYLNWNCLGCETPFSFLASSVRVLCRSPRSPTQNGRETGWCMKSGLLSFVATNQTARFSRLPIFWSSSVRSPIQRTIRGRQVCLL